MSHADLNGTMASIAAAPAPSAATATGGPANSVRGAIARAAAATGVDFSYLLAQARIESSLDPQARSAASSAAGLYQFTKGTWSTMLARHGASLGSANAAALPTSRAGQLAMRYDPNASAMMAAKLAGDNTTALTAVLGRAPSASELYLAHFLGSGGATRFLSALGADPGQSAAALLPKAAAANPSVFYDASGAPLSLGGVMALVQARMDAALQGSGNTAGAVSTGNVYADVTTDVTTDLGGLGAPAMTPLGAGPIAQQSGAEASGDAAQTASDGPASMADTLRNTFGLSGDSTSSGDTPAFVRSAYGRLQALGL